jgi:hypothetical protein
MEKLQGKDHAEDLWADVKTILETAYTVDACALTSILPSLPLIDMI